MAMLKTKLDYSTFIDYFRSGCKKPDALQIGVEWEKVGVDRETGRAIPYFGPRGVRAIFEALQARFGWKAVLSQSGDPIALNKGPVAITLEPGGQIELSGQQAPYIFDNGAELHLHLAEIREVSEPLDIVWLGIGAQPFSRHADIEWVPKDRYGIMRESLKSRGELTYSMMKETASVQVSLDYTSEQDAIDKLRLALALAPFFTAIFANSPLEGGERSRYLSRRTHIWLGTDPDRTGVLYDVFEPDFSFRRYAEFALSVPVLFIKREGRWIGMPPMSFGEFLKNGYNGWEAEPADWELHLTTIFIETRLKKYLEIRSMDCQNIPMGLAAVGFVKGLFYDARSRQAAWALLKDIPVEERRRMRAQASETALKTAFTGGKTLQYAAEALVEMAESGLRGDEKRFLAPLKELLASGRCPAEKLLGCTSGAPSAKAKVEQIIACAGI